MIILIAESKTMRDGGMPVAQEMYVENCPAGEDVADEVMHRLALMSVPEIVNEIKIGSKMASKIAAMAYEFPNKGIGLRAIEAFTGVVFKAFDYGSLSVEDKGYADSHVRIISSLYGWLRPLDIIKGYRTDFTTRLAPGNKPFSDYWRKDVTIQLVRELQRTGETDILNLLPGDAAKCVDWKLVKRFAKVWKVDFKELLDGGDYKTPHAGKLKTLRGELLRAIITQRITSPSSLLTFNTDTLLPLGTPDYPDHIAFCV